MTGSFLGQICSNVSGSIFQLERMLLRRLRCTDDFTLVWLEMSVLVWNLVSGRVRTWLCGTLYMHLIGESGLTS